MMQLTVFNVCTIAMMALTVWVMWARFACPLESNWPLIYTLAVVIYSRVFEGSLDPYWVYAGVVAGLLLRFEFMGGWFLRIVRCVELLVLSYYLWRGASLLLQL